MSKREHKLNNFSANVTNYSTKILQRKFSSSIQNYCFKNLEANFSY